MKTYLIERNVPGIGAMSPEEMSRAATSSNEALAKLAPRVQWQHSYVTSNKTFCIYIAENEDVVREHSKLSGFPADVITPINARIDPTIGAG